MKRRKQILVLYWHPAPLEEMRVAIRHHLRALDSSEMRHDLIYYNAVTGAPSWLRHCRFDAVILHTTLLCLRWSHLFYEWKWKLRWVADLQCPKVAFPQDEYDHAEILDEWLYEWGVSLIFTNFGSSERRLLYPIMSDKAHFHECFTGYIDPSIAECSRQALPGTRPNDLVYRATHLPYWFGSHGQLKHRLAEVVAPRARALGLRCDISTREEDTILGDQWLMFLASGRAVIGCESGSSVLDRRGEIRAKIQTLLRSNPGATFDEVARVMSPGWDDYRFVAISPRHFEAVMTKTCQILVEGRYSGVLEPQKHYVPLKRDFGNLDQALEFVRDQEAVQAMAERAFHDIYRSGRYTYRALAAELDEALGLENMQVSTFFNRILRPLARLRSRLATTSLETLIRFDRMVEACKGPRADGGRVSSCAGSPA